jgi:hypothetical protein
MAVQIARFSVFARFGLAAVVAISIEYLRLALEVDRAHDQLCLNAPMISSRRAAA